MSFSDKATFKHSGSRLEAVVWVDLPSLASGARVVLKTTVQIFCEEPLNSASFDHEQLLTLALERVRFQSVRREDPREKLKALRAEFRQKQDAAVEFHQKQASELRGGGVAGSLRDGGGDGAEFSAYPDGNNGDNQTNPTDKAVP